MDTLFSLSRPTNFTVDLRSCVTVGELVALLKKDKPELIEEWDKVPFVLRWSGGAAALPLNGHECNEHAALPNPQPAVFYISPKILEYDIIAVSFQDALSENKTFPYDLSVRYCDTGLDLKKLIEKKSNIPANSQVLRFKGTVLLDDVTLFARGIGRNAFVSVETKLQIIFKFNQATVPMWYSPESLLTHALERFAKKAGHGPSDLLFRFSKTTGQANIDTKSWLPDQVELFKAKHACGTVGANGLQHGDSIQVFKMISRRKTLKGNSSGDGAGKTHEVGCGVAAGSALEEPCSPCLDAHSQ